MSTLNASQRKRSPRFPGYAIGDVIEYAKRIYGGVHRATVPSDTVFRLMGFAGKSGPSSAALGAMRQFGLIEGIGDRTRLSDLALSIVQPASEQERIEGVRQAARNPEVFRLIYDRFDEHVPAADEPIKAYLIRELGFSKRGADECLNSLRKTLRTLEELTGESGLGAIDTAPELTEGRDQAIDGVQPQTRYSPSVTSEGEFVRIPLTRECVAELRFEGQVTERAIANLMRHIELMQDVWAEDE